jgi:hypothetical protein
MLPERLVEELDLVVEPRKRSAFVEAAVREKLVRERQLRQLRSLRETAGLLETQILPDWRTPAGTTAWVRTLRDQDEATRPRRDL